MGFLLSILSGILLGIGFVFPNLNFMGWIVLIPLLFLLNSKKITYKKAFLAGLIAGFIYFGQVLIWGFQTWPLDWAGIGDKFFGFLLVFLIWLIATSFLALFIGFFSLSFKFLTKRNCFDLFLIPCLWIIFEYLRAVGFSIFFSGNASLFGSHWTWGHLGYLLNENSILRPIASFGGIYLLSFLIVFLNAIFYFLLKKVLRGKKLRKEKIIGILLLAILILISYQFEIKQPEFSQPSFKISILQNKFPSAFYISKETRIERLNTQKNLVRGALENSPEIIIFPEDARFLPFIDKEFFEENFKQNQVSILESSRTETAEGTKSIIVFYNSRDNITTNSEKLLLSPFGEYLPYIIKLPSQILNKKWAEKFEHSRGYKKGKEMTVFSTANNWQGGSLLCSEIFSPDLHRKITNQGAQVLFNLGSLSFAHGSKILDSQTQAVLQFRAAENNRYLVRATNFGTSYIIDNKGKIVRKTQNSENQVLNGGIVPQKEKTFYTKFGDWILMLAFGMISFLITKKLIKK